MKLNSFAPGGHVVLNEITIKERDNSSHRTTLFLHTYVYNIKKTPCAVWTVNYILYRLAKLTDKTMLPERLSFKK